MEGLKMAELVEELLKSWNVPKSERVKISKAVSALASKPNCPFQTVKDEERGIRLLVPDEENIRRFVNYLLQYHPGIGVRTSAAQTTLDALMIVDIVERKEREIRSLTEKLVKTEVELASLQEKLLSEKGLSSRLKKENEQLREDIDRIRKDLKECQAKQRIAELTKAIEKAFEKENKEEILKTIIAEIKKHHL